MKIHGIAIVVVCLLAITSFPRGVTSEESLSSDVEITKVGMFEHNLRCKQLGGQMVDTGVTISYVHNSTVTKPFTISIFLDGEQYLAHQNVTKEMIDDGKNRILFPGIYFNTSIGNHTFDAYVNYDIRTHKSCDFYTSVFGFGLKVTPFWKFIWDTFGKFF